MINVDKVIRAIKRDSGAHGVPCFFDNIAYTIYFEGEDSFSLSCGMFLDIAHSAYEKIKSCGAEMRLITGCSQGLVTFRARFGMEVLKSILMLSGAADIGH